jgi:hypothetical protein
MGTNKYSNCNQHQYSQTSGHSQPITNNQPYNNRNAHSDFHCNVYIYDNLNSFYLDNCSISKFNSNKDPNTCIEYSYTYRNPNERSASRNFT